ncbi:hypothetical protein M413DRAFT_446114 [Hebeloma cylindrosporum]|uniref:MYND-type domain-containing protein n=1 Tax=Hebeloma cylindrosporum TaxID=76867 RepID=A0A0C3C935_HEBCY|nr:hypothetical protein M413DRAFT_446114 [Hebeloma cylindrosporum h7]
MSDFAKLKQSRKAHQKRSFVTGDFREPGKRESDVFDKKSVVDSEVSSQGTSSSRPDLLDIRGQYSAIPPALEVRVTEGNGRGIYTKFNRRPGEILFSVKPHIAALSNQHLEEYCSSCFAPKADSLRRCTGCKLLYYCDEKCQAADWTFHRHECTGIQKWVAKRPSGSSSFPGDAIRCLVRILWRKQKLGSQSVWAREIDGMQSHRTSLSRDSNTHESQLYAQLAHSIVNFLGLNSPQELAEFGLNGVSDLVDLISRFTTNTFTVSTPSLAPLGSCVSPAVALINHSCDPNAVVVFPRATETAKGDEPLMQVIALKNISVDDEILTAYIDTTLPRDLRQKHLRETYHFTCGCNLCAPPTDASVDWREAMWCPKKCGGICPLPTEQNSLVRCSKCQAPVRDTDAVLDAVRVGQEGLDKAEALQFSDPEKATRLTTNLIPILISSGLVPAAHPLLGLSRLHSSLLIAHLPPTDPGVEEIRSPEVQAAHPASSQKVSPEEAQEALDEAIRAARRAYTGLSQVLVEGHPMRGIACAELGKLLSVDEPHPTHLEAPGEGTNAASPSLSGPSAAATSPMGVSMSPPTYPPSGPARLKLAYETLVRARTELMIGFGGKNEGGEVGRDVRNQIAEIEKELMVWKSGIRNAWQDRPKQGK